MGGLTSAVLVAEVGEAPHVAQADDGARHRQDELNLVAPLAALLHLLLVLVLHLVLRPQTAGPEALGQRRSSGVTLGRHTHTLHTVQVTHTHHTNRNRHTHVTDCTSVTHTHTIQVETGTHTPYRLYK